MFGRKNANLNKRWSCAFPFLFLLIFLAGQAHAGTFTAYGPRTFQRGTGQPVTETDSFSVLNPNTTYTLNAYNGGLLDDEITGELVSSGEIHLNGVLVIGPQNFSQNVSSIIEPVTLQTVNNLFVEVRGKPGGTLVIDIVGIDNDPPSITAFVDIPPNAAGWNNTSVTVSFDCSDAISGIQTCPPPITVNTEGANQIISGTAFDLAGNSATASVSVSIDTISPVITLNNTPAETNDPSLTLSGSVSDANSITSFTINNNPLTLSTNSFTTNVTLIEGSNAFTFAATDIAGNTGTADLVISFVPDAGGIPPDPATVAPEIDQTVATTLGSATEFLHTGNNPIQRGVAPGTIEPIRVAVLRGKVMAGDGTPLSGVKTTILNHPEFGNTLTREDGMFDMAVNGGGILTVNYELDGF